MIAPPPPPPPRVPLPPLPPGGCETLYVGSCGGELTPNCDKSRPVVLYLISPHVECPSFVDKHNWLTPIFGAPGARVQSADRFTVAQDGQRVEVSRADFAKNKGWEMDLQFHCCARPPPFWNASTRPIIDITSDASTGHASTGHAQLAPAAQGVTVAWARGSLAWGAMAGAATALFSASALLLVSKRRAASALEDAGGARGATAAPSHVALARSKRNCR